MKAERIEHRASFGGWQDVWRMYSESLRSDTTVGVYLPPQATTTRCPVLYWLSGLTCTEQNFITKAGAQRFAAELGIILVVPDTSPRGAAIPDTDGVGVGQGASFYLDATQQPWSTHYRMESWVVHELPNWVQGACEATSSASIAGHSMGGHGALTLALRHPEQFRSASAFAPIGSPSRVPWGRAAFEAYLGADEASWAQHDAECLILRGHAPELPMRIDQGGDDAFLERELQPTRLLEAARFVGRNITFQMHAGYDHSYYFIASFIEAHLRFHAVHLRA